MMHFAFVVNLDVHNTYTKEEKHRKIGVYHRKKRILQSTHKCLNDVWSKKIVNTAA